MSIKTTVYNGPKGLTTAPKRCYLYQTNNNKPKDKPKKQQITRRNKPMARYIRHKDELIVREKKLTKKQIKEAQEREEFLRRNRNGVFGSIY